MRIGARRGRRRNRQQTLPLSMKEGRVVKLVGFAVAVRVRGGVVGFERGSSLYRVLGGMIRSDGSLGPVAQLNEGRLGGQRGRGACRSEGLVAGEHVPDRLG